MLSRIQHFACPTCGSPIGEAQPIERLSEGDFTRQQRLIIETMRPHVGAWMPTEQIEKALWDAVGRKSINPSKRLVATQISNMQSELVLYGWTIAGDRRGHYKLIPMERGA
jgi:hypothetical protein